MSLQFVTGTKEASRYIYWLGKDKKTTWFIHIWTSVHLRQSKRVQGSKLAM